MTMTFHSRLPGAVSPDTPFSSLTASDAFNALSSLDAIDALEAPDVSDASLTAACGSSCGLAYDLHAVLGAVPAMLWVGDATGARQWIGTAFAAFSGLPGAARAGQEWLDALHPEDIERCRGIQLTCATSAMPFSLDYRLRRRDGRYRWVMDLAAPQRASRDGRFGYAGVCVDIHERRELEDRLAERTRKLRTGACTLRMR